MLRLGLAVVAIFVGAPTLAQQPTRGVDLQLAQQQWTRCLDAESRNLPATVTPEAGATRVISACASHQSFFRQQWEAVVAEAPSARQPELRAAYQADIDRLPAGVANGIRNIRAGNASAESVKDQTRALFVGRWRAANATCAQWLEFGAGGEVRRPGGSDSRVTWQAESADRISIGERANTPFQIVSRDHVILRPRGGAELDLRRCPAENADARP